MPFINERALKSSTNTIKIKGFGLVIKGFNLMSWIPHLKK